MKEIRGQEQSIKQLIDKKYAVDSYQREYKWEKKQLDDLTDDLLSAFDEYYKDSHERQDVRNYGQYFLGPIIVSTDKQKRHIVDGQQRLTTLTLALICLLHMLDNDEQKSMLRNLIYSESFGEKSFNLDVPERVKCLMALYKEEIFDVKYEPESVRNMVARYEQMRSKLTESLSTKQILLFTDWLIEKVYLVEITTSATTDAYKIFETMNDRGLRLTPTEMLKGYLLMEIKNENSRELANTTWKEKVDLLMYRKGEDADFIKSWLRARHAMELTDFEEIGSQFHRWARHNNDKIRLTSSIDFEKFITRDFVFYSKKFMQLRQAAEKYDVESGLECVHYLAQHSFTLQYPLLLAPLSPDNSPQDIQRKLRVVAAYLDILIHRRIGNWKLISESQMRNKIFDLIPEIRDKDATEIADFLALKLEQEEPKETLVSELRIHVGNGPKIKRILARITDYMETQSGKSTHYADYFAPGQKAFQIEHIWHDNYAEVCSEEEINPDDLNENDFQTMRDRIGGLLLLPQKDNASYGARPYTKKREYYQNQNLLAGSLHETCYGANTGFRQLIQNSGLPFESHPRFQKQDLEKRQSLYRKIADKIWHPDRLREAANGD